jgi:archaellum component FlaC
MPIIVISVAILLLFIFWVKIEPEITAFTNSYHQVKKIIATSTDEVNKILGDTKKHLVETIESSGIPELITAYQTAIRGLDGLCGPQSQNTVYLPPASNDYFYQTKGAVIHTRMMLAANPSRRYAGSVPYSPGMNNFLLQVIAGKPDYSQRQFNYVFLKLDGGKIKQETKKLETGLNNALKKAGKDVETAWEKAKKDVAETGSRAVVTFSQEIEKIKTEFSETIAGLSKAAKQTAKNFGAQMDTMAKNSCELVTGPLAAIIKPVLQSSIEPFMHLDNAIEDLKKLIALQVKIKDILSESGKMYENLSQALNLFLAMIKKMVYLLAILLIFITIHRITSKTEEIKKGWQLLTS